jgi:putative iron-regulated protein
MVSRYADHVHGLYSESLTLARAFHRAAEELVAAPTENNLARARQAWLLCRGPYGQTEAFRFYDGPIDGQDGPEGQLNGWPLDESYIDYVEGKPDSGIVADRTIEISPKDLILYNEGALGGTFERDTAISTGYHAIEFLLWGQDQSKTGPGARPASDFAPPTKNADRRGQYLLAAGSLVQSDLAALEAAWAPGQDNYRKTFEADPKLAAQRIFVGIATLSKRELASERIDVALENHDQEDEHSCFSDNTRNDLIGNAVGIQKVWGEPVHLFHLLADIDPALANETDRAIHKSVELVEAIPDPFDQVILDPASSGYQTASQAVDALYDQADLLVRVADTLGVEITIAEVAP